MALIPSQEEVTLLTIIVRTHKHKPTYNYTPPKHIHTLKGAGTPDTRSAHTNQLRLIGCCYGK